MYVKGTDRSTRLLWSKKKTEASYQFVRPFSYCLTKEYNQVNKVLTLILPNFTCYSREPLSSLSSDVSVSVIPQCSFSLLRPVPAEGTDYMKTARRETPYHRIPCSLPIFWNQPPIRIAVLWIWVQLCAYSSDRGHICKCGIFPRFLRIVFFPLDDKEIFDWSWCVFPCIVDWIDFHGKLGQI